MVCYNTVGKKKRREYEKSQSLLFEVWFPTIKSAELAIVNESQSLLFEVWFPTELKGGMFAIYIRRNPFYLRSGFLLAGGGDTARVFCVSQSLLFEVWFPTFHF